MLQTSLYQSVRFALHGIDFAKCRTVLDCIALSSARFLKHRHARIFLAVRSTLLQHLQLMLGVFYHNAAQFSAQHLVAFITALNSLQRQHVA